MGPLTLLLQTFRIVRQIASEEGGSKIIIKDLLNFCKKNEQVLVHFWLRSCSKVASVILSLCCHVHDGSNPTGHPFIEVTVESEENVFFFLFLVIPEC